MEVREPEDAYTIFEALNDRGLELSIFDLLKNHIYRELGAKNESIANVNWTKLAANLRDRKPDEFIRLFWILRYGRIQKGTLFTRIKESYSGQAKAQRLIKEMVVDADLYAGLDSADADIWQTHGDAVREDIKTIATLGGNQSRPVLLAALKADWKAGDYKKLTNALIALIVRHQIVGRERTGALEIFCADLAYEIFSNSCPPQDAMKKLKAFYPNDDKFQSDFLAYEETRAQRAKYFLVALNRAAAKQLKPNSAEEMEVIRDPEKVTVEHIFPKRHEANQSWAVAVSANTNLPDLVNRLGNQCLLAKGPNVRIGNKDFATKKQSYARSTIAETFALSQCAEWTPKEIEQRQARLAKLAIQVWKV